MKTVEHVNNIIIYQKSNGDLFLRGTKHDYGLKVGKKTSMGWTVLKVLYEYEGNYYEYRDFMKARRHKQHEIKTSLKKRIARKMIYQLSKSLY